MILTIILKLFFFLTMLIILYADLQLPMSIDVWIIDRLFLKLFNLVREPFVISLYYISPILL